MLTLLTISSTIICILIYIVTKILYLICRIILLFFTEKYKRLEVDNKKHVQSVTREGQIQENSFKNIFNSL